MKKLNLLGIRKRAVLCRTKSIGGDMCTIMEEISEQQEQELDASEHTTVHDNYVSRKSVYIYGEVNFNSPDDIEAIKKFNLIDDSQRGSIVHSGFNYDKGEVLYEEAPKFHSEFDPVAWFKYNYCLIGKPKRIIVREVDKYLL